MNDNLPAVLGGDPAFPEGLPLVRPAVPDVAAELAEVLASGQLTNGRHVRALEDLVAETCQVRNAVAVSSCTAGLMLVYRVLGAQGRVVLPSMTFAASAHAVVWAGGSPVWADIDRRTGGIDPQSAADALDGAVALSGTHVYGGPCDVAALEDVAAEARVPLVLDAAHALGASLDGRPVGASGSAEVFSLSPTKVAVAGEGGIVTTQDDSLAEALRIGRDYGNPGNYDTQFVGLNARMSELHAVVGVGSVRRLRETVEHRNALVQGFAELTSDVAGLRLVDVRDGCRSTWKDLTVVVEPSVLGLRPNQVAAALRVEGVDTRRYFEPPCHRQKAYADMPPERELVATDWFTARVLTLPLHTGMTKPTIARLATAVRRLADSADRVGVALEEQRSA